MMSHASRSASTPPVPKKAWSGPSSDLVAVLEKRVKAAEWLTYGTKLAKAPLGKKTIVMHSAWVLELEQICPSLKFTEKQMTQVFREIHSRVGASWTKALKKDCVDRWCVTMAKRVRTVVSHYRAAKFRKPQPKWMLQMCGGATRLHDPRR